MIRVYYDKGIRLECTPDIASSVIGVVNAYQDGIGNKGGNAIIAIEDKYADKLNKDLIPLKSHIQVDKSFKEWVAKYKAGDLKPQEPKRDIEIIIKVGTVFSKIIAPSGFLPHKKIEDVCKYFFKPAVRQKRFQEKKWDGFIHLYEKRFHRFPSGLLDDVKGVLNREGIKYRVDFIYDTEPPREFEWVAKDIFTPEPDQWESLNAALAHSRGVVKAPTGFGKTSFFARYLLAARGVPTIFIANKKSLLDDAADDFRNGVEGLNPDDVAQIKDGWFGDINLRRTLSFEKEDLDNALVGKKVIVATIQSLNARLEDPRTKGPLLYWLNNVCKLVMADECQAVGTKIWDDILKEIRAPYRIFLSATPRRTDGSTLKLIAYSGPIIYTTSAEEQIEKGRLCDLDIQYHVYNHKMFNDDDTGLEYAEMYKLCIAENMERNKFIVQKTFELIDEERFVLVLIQFIDHGEILKNMFMEQGLNPSEIAFVWGETSDKKRTEIISDARKGKYKIIIGSTIFDAGVNIPTISGVVLAGAGNSDITLIQRIGRGARNCDYEKVLGYQPLFMKNNNGVKKTVVIDFVDQNIKFFNKQAKNRYFNAREEFGVDRVHIVNGDSSVFRARRKTTVKETPGIDEQTMAKFKMMSEFDSEYNENKNSNVDVDKSINNLLEAFNIK